MFRWVIIISLFAYVLYKFGFFRSLSSGYNEKQPLRKPPNSNVNVDNPPPKEKKRSTFKGGDYVDYEEIK
jgi:hypothetical protein